MPELAELEVWLKMRDEELQRGLAGVDKRLDSYSLTLTTETCARPNLTP